jgi:hypothetical protein
MPYHSIGGVMMMIKRGSIGKHGGNYALDILRTNHVQVDLIPWIDEMEVPQDQCHGFIVDP